MSDKKEFYFVTHSRQDHEKVQPLIEGLEARGIPLWLDTMLAPGEVWDKAIYEGLQNAKGLLVFLSKNSLKSPLVKKQLAALENWQQDNIIPIQLEAGIKMPATLSKVPSVDIANEAPEVAVDEIATAITKLKVQPPAPLDEQQTKALAEAIADATRLGVKSSTGRTPDSIFIVHGHDLVLRDEVHGYLKGLGIESVILSEIAAGTQSLFQKFLTFSEEVEFAVVLLTADDYGASRVQYDAPNVAERALQFRARQNVILELGFFYGYLGWENVFVLYKSPSEVFPNFETPSDLAGILFDHVDPEGKWKEKLWARLEQAGFEKH